MSQIFLKIVNMSISAGWLVLVVFALRLALKKAPKWVRVLMWGIVAARLLCPVSLESALSLIPSSETISPDIMMDRTPGITTGIPYLNNAINPIISTSFAPEPMASANPLQILIPVAANLWLLGVLAMGLYTAVSYFTLKKKVSTAVRLRENIFRSEYIASPFVLGLWKPEIYLPYSLSEQETAHVIAHEQAHILRKDHWWKPLGFALLAVHWFNPLLWVAYVLLCRDIELACDEKVIAGLDTAHRADYSQALLRCSVTRRSIAACPLAFGEVGVKERVKNVLHYKKPAFWVLVVSVVVCAAVAVCFLTDPLTAPPAALPLVHSHSYRTVELLYEAPGVKRDSFINPRFSVTEEMELRMKSDEISYNGWASLGTLSEIPEERLADSISGGTATRDVRKNAARGWHLRNASTETEFTLIQTKNNELFLNIGVIVPPGGSVKEGYLYRLGLDLTEDYNLLATSGGNAVPVTIFPDGTPLRDCVKAVQWLTIDPGDDLCPFRVYDNGEEVYGAHAAFDAETFESLKYFLPSGLEPQTYLFQNADPNREYIVVLDALTSGGGLRCFGVRWNNGEETDLVPTDADVTGIFDCYLFLDTEQGKIRYIREDPLPGGIQAGSVVYEDEGYTVFSVKGVDDGSVVLVYFRQEDLMCLYRYCPAGAANPEELEQAKISGWVVLENDDVTAGQEIFLEFYEKTQKGMPVTVTIASWRTLDPDRCSKEYYEACHQDYPSLCCHVLSYDGKTYTLTDLSTGEISRYSFLLHFSGKNQHGGHGGAAERYVLTQSARVTWEELFRSLLSSAENAYIDHRVVYTDQ